MNIPLTQLSKSSGCGCKLGPAVLENILAGSADQAPNAKLIVGTDTRDDAAAYDLGDGTALISTTDFFTPIVDDPFDFGRIASVNALSDVYAMGGTPLMALGILGWPVDAQPIEPVAEIMRGARKVCADAGIVLAGGHSVDTPEPLFGLAVNGRVRLEHLKRNSTAQPGDVLYLTKPVGVGLLSNAHRKGMLKPEHANLALNVMLGLNTAGEMFGRLDYVHAMTDVTGFGLLGHLFEMCEGAGLGVEITYASVPLINEAALRWYIDEGCVPGATMRNWQQVSAATGSLDFYRKAILCDPQTSGGLLVAVDANHLDQYRHVCMAAGLELSQPIGAFTATRGIQVA
jgi:selenide,water dikinase